MTHGSLFSGIGGFDLAAHKMQWQNIFHCEIEPFARHVLQYYWPEAISYSDITKTDFSKHYGTIDIISGGFPCQPYSVAGKRKGSEDERHLWPQMLRAIREVAPRYIVAENVPGLVSWSAGLVFEQVQADLENEGYQVQPILLPAAGINAPHKRERLWIVAHAKSDRHNRQPEKNGQKKGEGKSQKDKRQWIRNEFSRNDATEPATNPDQQHWNESTPEKNPPERQPPAGCNSKPDTTNPHKQLQILGNRQGQKNRRNKNQRIKPSGELYNWQTFPTQHPVCCGNDGFSDRLDRAAIFAGRKPNKNWSHFNKWRNETLKGYGNAIVPQVALQIFRAIEQTETQTPFFKS